MESSAVPSGAAESCERFEGEQTTFSHLGYFSFLTFAATQELSSPTLPSSLFQHSTRVVILATHSLLISCAFTHLSLYPCT